MLNAKVLQLSATYEPDRIIDARAAHRLLLRQKAEAPHGYDGPVIELRSSQAVHPLPSVIRLKHYIDLRRKRNESGKRRHRIFVRDRFRCQYCGVKFAEERLTVDHIIPVSQHGTDDPVNLVTSCGPCNRRKGPRTPEQARMPLFATPSALRYGLDKAMLRHYAIERPEWLPYLFLDKAA